MTTPDETTLSIPDKLDAYRGDALRGLPVSLDADTAAVLHVGDKPTCLTLHECEQLAEFLVAAAKEARDAQMRAFYLTRPEMQNAPNFCRSCGHLNHPDKRGWCPCEICGALMDRGPFPGQSREQHEAAKCP